MTPSREFRLGVWLELIGRDIAAAFHQLLKSPAFSLTVIGTLALGIAACTVVFTAIDRAMLHPIDSDSLDRYVLIHETKPPVVPQAQVSPPTYLDIERESKSFECVGAWTRSTYTLTGEAEPISIIGASVTEHVFQIMGNRLALGRGFVADDFRPSADRVMVLGASLWKTGFGSSKEVIGRVVHFDTQAYTVIGVLSEEFARLGSDIQAWTPLMFNDDQRAEPSRGAHFLQVQALLKPGVALSTAQAELDLLARRIGEQHPQTNQGSGLLVRDFRTYLNRSLRPLLLLMLAAVGCVMAIACANVANLLLARAATRQREMTIRAALGAGRGRLIRQLLAESVLLSLLAGGAGVGLALWGLRFLRVYGPAAGTDLARLSAVELNGGILAFTLGFSVLTGLLFGLAPAWLASGVNLNDALKQGARGSTESRGRGRLRGTLVTLEVALALMLLSGAGVLVRSFIRLAKLDPGFSPSQMAIMRVEMRMPKYANGESRFAFAQALLERLKSLPNVETAALTSVTPFNTPNVFFFGIQGQQSSDNNNRPGAIAYVVTPEYFQTAGLRVLRGQLFSGQVEPTGPPPAVINEALAKRYFGETDPLGQHLIIGNGPGQPLEIVAVVNDVMQGDPAQPAPPQIYVSWRLGNPGGYFALIRTRGTPGALLSSMRPQVYVVDKDQPAGLPRRMTDMMDDTMARQNLTLRVLIIFALFALLIAAIGIYGIISYSVAQRTMEIGVRMALGASAGDIIRQFLLSGFKLVLTGLAVGLAAAFALGPAVQSVLFNANPRDPAMLGAISLILLLVSVFACLIPARRAAKVDPLVALRSE